MTPSQLLIVSIGICIIAAKSNLRPVSVPAVVQKDDSDKSVPEYVTSYGYAFEEHHVTTADGYILTLWRIPGRLGEPRSSKLKSPVLLQHGILDTGFSYLFQEIRKNLAIMLVEQGYDVWIGNSRGNTYSRKHIDMVGHNPSNYSSKFWDFSWDELGEYDLPAMLTYIKSRTGAARVKYVCHSQGCTMLVVLGCLDPGFLDSNIDAAAAFAPAMHAYYQQSVGVDIMRLIEFTKHFAATGRKCLFGQQPYIDASSFLGKLMPALWMGAINFLVGWTDKLHIDLKRVAVLAAHEPGGSSLRSYDHFVQGVYNSTFRRYDFGAKGNLAKYGQDTPPAYNVSNLKSLNMKWYVVYGEKDAMITPKSVRTMLGQLRPNHYQAEMMKDGNHLDVCWGESLYNTIFPRVLDFFAQTEAADQ